MNGDEVRDARFLSSDGYDAGQVDDLLRRVAVELDAGRPAGPLIAGAALTAFPHKMWRRSRRYEIGAVDWFLDQLLRREDASQARTSADPWRDLAVVNHFTRSGPGDLAERTATPSRQALRKVRNPGPEVPCRGVRGGVARPRPAARPAPAVGTDRNRAP